MIFTKWCDAGHENLESATICATCGRVVTLRDGELSVEQFPTFSAVLNDCLEAIDRYSIPGNLMVGPVRQEAFGQEVKLDAIYEGILATDHHVFHKDNQFGMGMVELA